jgi:serine/threonine-protein kinase
VLVVVLGLLTAYGTWWFVVGRYHSVPNVAGQSQAAALSELRGDGFTIAQPAGKQYSESVPSGYVISTSPRAGSHVLPDKRITVVVSRGPERFKVPAVNGSYDQAAQTLGGIPVRIVRVNQADPTGQIPADQVMSTDPAAGAEVKRGQVVKVIVSIGPPMVRVPDVRNQDENDAKDAVNGAGFKVTETQDFSNTVPEGLVISQNPPANSAAAKFSVVSIVISKGQGVAVPDIPQGSDPASANALLQSLGFQVNVHKKQKGIFDFSGYQVDHVNPPSGTVLTKGSTVTLFVS